MISKTILNSGIGSRRRAFPVIFIAGFNETD
jgi:hypothetical protein